MLSVAVSQNSEESACRSLTKAEIQLGTDNVADQ